jgi:hypothetical protein
MRASYAPVFARMQADREPHIGEYEAKTNAICDFQQIPAASESADNRPASCGFLPTLALPLLSVILQHLIACRG